MGEVVPKSLRLKSYNNITKIWRVFLKKKKEKEAKVFVVQVPSGMELLQPKHKSPKNMLMGMLAKP